MRASGRNASGRSRGPELHYGCAHSAGRRQRPLRRTRLPADPTAHPACPLTHVVSSLQNRPDPSARSHTDVEDTQNPETIRPCIYQDRISYGQCPMAMDCIRPAASDLRHRRSYCRAGTDTQFASALLERASRAVNRWVSSGTVPRRWSTSRACSRSASQHDHRSQCQRLQRLPAPIPSDQPLALLIREYEFGFPTACIRHAPLLHSNRIHDAGH